jgi:hypothetical protein
LHRDLTSYLGVLASSPLTICLFRKKDSIELKLPERKVLRKADSAANLPVTEFILCWPEPQAFSIDHPIMIMTVPKIIV